MAGANIIVKGELIKKFFKGLIKVYDEAVFFFDNDGLKVRCVDPANVLMVIATIPRDASEAYVVDGEVKVGVDLKRINEILKIAGNKDNVELTTDGEKITLRFRSIEYEISAISPDAIREPPKIPELDLNAVAVVDGEEFKKAINFAEKVADFITFVSDETGFYLECKGDVDAFKASLDTIEHNKENARSMYSLEYLKELVGILGKSSTVKVRLSNDCPTWLTFDIDGLIVEYILAPRIEEQY